MTAPQGSPRSLPGPQRLQQMHFSFAAHCVLAAGVKLDVFSIIAAGKQSAAAIAAAAQASERGIRMLLDALVGFELLSKRDGSYALTGDAERYLVRQSPEYMGAILENDEMWENWGRLADSARLGRSPRSVSRRDPALEFFPVLIRTLHFANREPA